MFFSTRGREKVSLLSPRLLSLFMIYIFSLLFLSHILKFHHQEEKSLEKIIQRVKYTGGPLTYRPVPFWSMNLQTRKKPLNLSACATLAHELANAKKCPLNLSIRATLIHEHANTKITPAAWHCSATWPPLVGHAWHRL